MKTGAESMILNLLEAGPKFTGELCRVVPCTQIQKPIQRLRRKLAKTGKTIYTRRVEGHLDFLNFIGPVL